MPVGAGGGLGTIEASPRPIMSLVAVWGFGGSFHQPRFECNMSKIIFGLIFIVGGLSGHLVLRGTGSSVALAAVGGVLLLIGIVQVAGRNS